MSTPSEKALDLPETAAGIQRKEHDPDKGLDKDNNNIPDTETKTTAESMHSSGGATLKPYEKLEKHPAYRKSVTFNRENPFTPHLLTDYLLTPQAKRKPLFVLFPYRASDPERLFDNSEVYSLKTTTKEITTGPAKKNSSHYHKFILGVLPANCNPRSVEVAYNAESLVFVRIIGFTSSARPPGTPFSPLPELVMGHTFKADPEKGLDAFDILIHYLEEKGFIPSRSPEEVTQDLASQGKTYEFSGSTPDVNGGTWVYHENRVKRYVSTNNLHVTSAPAALTPRFVALTAGNVGDINLNTGSNSSSAVSQASSSASNVNMAASSSTRPGASSSSAAAPSDSETHFGPQFTRESINIPDPRSGQITVASIGAFMRTHRPGE